MKVYLNSISGIPDALTSLLMSKRSWTPEAESEIRRLDRSVNNGDGTFTPLWASEDDIADYERRMKVLLRWGQKHITLLKFIDLSFTVEGIHRAGQDDWDAHAERYHNRIIRSSTRLAEFKKGEMSDWYKGKIIPTDEALDLLHMQLPETIEKDGVTYVRVVNGYIREDMKDDKDVKRGLYMLSIPSNFIFRCDLANFAHVYQNRNQNSAANPEVKMLAEECANLIRQYQPLITPDVLNAIQN